ncbi:hypothetical protein [Micromonospora sp. NPDC049374]|uniref:hypothetical protein n=1 Tax=unclassified Micromonospora TaxID=2617518 RepID=UPI003430160D
MTTSGSTIGTASPDITALISQYREVFVPAAIDYLEEKISANELRERWRPYYDQTFHRYDLSVEQAWRQSSGSEGRLESGEPKADPAHAVPLMHFPVSIAHNNLDRLIEVLVAELGDQTVAKTAIPARKVDFAHVVDRLDALMASLAD